MSAYNPPIRNLTIFDTLLFRDAQNDAFGDLDLRYLKFPNAQGTENLQGVNVSGIATFNNDLILNQDKIHLGTNSGLTNQGLNCVAVGADSGRSNQGAESVAIGRYAGYSSQQQNAVAVGAGAGQYSQVVGGVALGVSAGQYTQQGNAIAIGNQAGQGSFVSTANQQQANAVAIGASAGADTQGAQAVALGYLSGQTSQGLNATALGHNAGNSSQGNGAVAIGHNAAQTSQGTQSIAIGVNSATTAQAANSIQINSTGTTIAQATASSCVIAPIRSVAPVSTSNQLFYNDTTKEVFKSAPLASSVLGGVLSQQALATSNTWLVPTTNPSVSLPAAGVYIITYAISSLPAAGNVIMGCLSTISTAPYTAPQTTATSTNLLAFSGSVSGNNNWISASNTIVYTAASAITIYLYVACSAALTIRGGSGGGSYFYATRIA